MRYSKITKNQEILFVRFPPLCAYKEKHLIEAKDADQDIDNLIEKTEQEGEKDEKEEEVKDGALSFSFAKVWASDKGAMEEVQDNDQGDSWTQTLQKITAERDQRQAEQVVASGRGVRRAAAHKV
jgi:chromodomain-helicase-DNA-binding protein 4